jgi:hypothetical protein
MEREVSCTRVGFAAVNDITFDLPQKHKACRILFSYADRSLPRLLSKNLIVKNTPSCRSKQ